MITIGFKYRSDENPKNGATGEAKGYEISPGHCEERGYYFKLIGYHGFHTFYEKDVRNGKLKFWIIDV